jgi:hypothetical protein
MAVGGTIQCIGRILNCPTPTWRKSSKPWRFTTNYTRAQKREDNSYKDLADRLKKKEPQSETPTEARVRRGHEDFRAWPSFFDLVPHLL